MFEIFDMVNQLLTNMLNKTGRITKFSANIYCVLLWSELNDIYFINQVFLKNNFIEINY
jgi:hypothetical protein